MDKNRIKILLQNFYDGETSPEEEKILSDYFKSNDVADELAHEKEIFLHLHASDNTIDVPPTLEAKLENLIDGLANKKENKGRKINSRKLMIWVGSAAACIAILLSAGTYFKGNRNQTETAVHSQNGDQTENKINAADQQTILADNKINVADQQTILEAQKALVLLSQNFNKGVEQVNLVSENIEKTNKILDKTFNRK